MKSIASFVESLGDITHGSSYTNPYHLPRLRENLASYLSAVSSRPGVRIMLVGEALGYRGGLHTGIPFSSTRLLRDAPHAFLKTLKPTLVLEGDETEATASSLWQFLAGRRRIPLCWNAYPFHPHQPGNPRSNRAPNARELALGLTILGELIELYQPMHLIAVGNAAQKAVGRLELAATVSKVRHPSYGGKREFMHGMAAAYRRR